MDGFKVSVLVAVTASVFYGFVSFMDKYGETVQSHDTILTRKRNLQKYVNRLTAQDFIELIGPHNGSLDTLRNLLSGDKSIILVGNGPVLEPLGKKIDSYDVVVRINEYTKDTKYVGRKIDIHMINIGGHMNPMASVIRDGTPTIFLECLNFGRNYKFFDKDGEGKDLPRNCYAIKEDIFDNMCSISDSSRGFYTVLLFNKFFSNVSIVGFGGNGHHDDKNHSVSHNNAIEHIILQEMCNGTSIDCEFTPAFKQR